MSCFVPKCKDTVDDSIPTRKGYCIGHWAVPRPTDAGYLPGVHGPAPLVALAHRGSAYGNILFPHELRHEMRGGKFPKAHPCSENPMPVVFGRSSQPATTDPLGKFRARGYMASCFPEGDGIAFDPPAGHTRAQVELDVAECFGFRIKVVN